MNNIQIKLLRDHNKVNSRRTLYQETNNAEKTGFSLIELLIVIVIVGITVAIALPNYTHYVQESRRANCSGALINLAGAMERYFTTNNTYVGASLGTAAGNIFPNQCPIDGGTATYNLSIPTQTATSYTIQAAPVAGAAQASDSCGTLSITQTGAKSVSSSTVAACWQ